MKNIYLYGEMAEKFGPVYELEVDSPMEAFRFLGVQLEEYREYVSDCIFKVLRGNGDSLVELDEASLSFPLGSANDLHIVPVVSGGARGNGKVIVGAIVMAVAIVGAAYTGPNPALGAGAGYFSGAAFGVSTAFTWGNVFAIGLMLTLAGVSQMLAPKPGISHYESADQRSSYFLGGQVNQTQQGVAIPVVYGRVRIGSTVISVGLTTEQV